MRLLARAKVNLGIRVLGRRADGYHRIATVFQEIDLADRVDLKPARKPGIRLVVKGPFAHGVPRGPKNLAWRAAEMMGGGVEITLTKNIPVAAGLGGGSSDAAAVLRGMATLLRRGGPSGPPRADLNGSLATRVGPYTVRDMARRLGADVPFFLIGGRARAGGRGDRLTRLRRGPRLRFVLVNPGVPLSTAEVYREWDRRAGAGEASRGAGLTPQAILGRIRTTNDLAPYAERLCPAIGRVKEALARSGCGTVFLCGSGPTVAGVLPRGVVGRTVVRAIRRAGGRTGKSWWILVASSA